MTLIATALVLWAWIRPPGFGGHLWRAIVFYAVARAFEAGVLAAGPKIGWIAPGWTSSSLETFGSLAAGLLAGLIPAALLGLFLYRRCSTRNWQRLIAVATATVSGYLGAFAFGLLIKAIIRD
jgi:hypothetical protein